MFSLRLFLREQHLTILSVRLSLQRVKLHAIYLPLALYSFYIPCFQETITVFRLMECKSSFQH